LIQARPGALNAIFGRRVNMIRNLDKEKRLMKEPNLTRRQREIYRFLLEHEDRFDHPPSLNELCEMLGLSSRGSMHKQITALIQAGLVKPMNHLHRGIRLRHRSENVDSLPFMGYIAAGEPIEAIENPEPIEIPPTLRTPHPCYVLQVRGDSMIDDGILNGDYVIVEQRSLIHDHEIVVALIHGQNATLKRIERRADKTILYPANPSMQPMEYQPDEVTVQGVLVGQMRRYF